MLHYIVFSGDDESARVQAIRINNSELRISRDDESEYLKGIIHNQVQGHAKLVFAKPWCAALDKVAFFKYESE